MDYISDFPYFGININVYMPKSHFLFRIVTVVISHTIKTKRWNTCVISCGCFFLAIFLSLSMLVSIFLVLSSNIWYEWATKSIHSSSYTHTHTNNITWPKDKKVKNKDQQQQKERTRDNPNWMCNEIKIYIYTSRASRSRLSRIHI